MINMASHLDSNRVFIHKVKNKLTTILMNLSLLKSEIELNADNEELIRDMENDIISLNRIIDDYFNSKSHL